MMIVAGFDVHRARIALDALDTESGEVTRGRIESTPRAVERWVGRFPGLEVHVAVEACTGWRFVCRALERAGAVPHLAEPVGTSAPRGRNGRRPIARTPAGCVSCCSRGACRSRGWRPSTCASGARARGCERR
jgi:hypothetical protein